MNHSEFDFGGYATRNDIKCADNRVIRSGAFADMDGKKVPLVYHHIHDDIKNVLGHVILENRDDGVYCYGKFNNSENAKLAKEAVAHGDVNQLSIYANKLKQQGSNVLHGIIREVSLVLAGANPGALIDNVEFQHGDDFVVSEEDALIYTGLNIETDLSHADDEPAKSEKPVEEKPVAEEKTVKDVYDAFDEDEKLVVNALVEAAVEQALADAGVGDEEEIEQSAIGGKSMAHNIFENQDEEDVISHAEIEAVFDDMQRIGTFRGSLLAHSITNVEYLFPEAQTVTPTPESMMREMEWVTKVLSATRKSPFARVKSTAVDLTADEARAKGYIKGREKLEQVIVALKRVTTPQTVYKKQALDRDDIIDIKDFDVVAYIAAEMRVMLNEEIARAILIGDGRSVSDPDKINDANIRAIWTDDELYSVHKALAVTAETTLEMKAKEFIDEAIRQRKYYKGSGTPVAYLGTDLLTACRLLKDDNGYRLYKTDQELADDLRVKEIVEIGLFDDQSREVGGKTRNLGSIIGNLMDYSIGTDRGGEISAFDDFDIDFNKMKYLIETRLSGAAVRPKSFLVLEFEVTTTP